jgi:hypothetical protein
LYEYLNAGWVNEPRETTTDKEVDIKLRELKKERIKIQTANVERNRLDRVEARQEFYYQNVGSMCAALPLPIFNMLQINNSDDEISYLLSIADVQHYGAKFVSENNKYSPEIAMEGFEYLAGKIASFIQEYKVEKLYIVSLGDLLQGILRISDLKLNDSSVVKATVEISRIMAMFLVDISKHLNIEYYHCSSANHTQLRPLGSKASELGDENLEYLIGNYISDLCSDNERIVIHLAKKGKKYIEIDIPGQEIVAMHGHQIKNIESSVKDLSMMRRSFLDTLLLGHYHSGKEIPSHEGCCGDCQVLISPSFIGSDPYSDSIMKGGKASVKIYGFDNVYGHTETHKIILN